MQNRDVQTGERPRGARTAAPPEGEPAQPTADLASPAPSPARARHRPGGPADGTSRRGVAGLVDALRGRGPSPRAAAFIPAAVLGLMAAGRGTPLATELRSWDGVWMLSIAQYGYDGVPVTLVDAFGRHTADTPYAFFPGYPAAIAAVGVLTGGNLVVAALLVTTLAGVVAAYGLVRLAELMPGGSRRAGLLLVALFAAAPMGVVLSMAYTEALFCAPAVWALVGVLRRQWLLAGLCTAASTRASRGLLSLLAWPSPRESDKSGWSKN